MRSACCFLGLLLAIGCSNVAGDVPGSDAGACPANPASGDDGGGGGGDGDDAGSNACAPGDTDGINGGCYSFVVTVDDTAFSPVILKTENLGQVTLELKNAGTTPHDLVIGCIPTPNGQGCPTQSCFPAAANIPAVAPGSSATVTFVTPNPEGIYEFRSDVGTDSQQDADGGFSGLWGQFVVQ